MTLRAGDEFNNIATPDPELLLKLANLAAQDSDSVLTGGLKSARAAFGSASRNRTAENEQMLLEMARLADPAYQAMAARINADLDLMDERSVYLLQEIEQALLTLRQERERMLEQAYKDEQGRAIAMTEDGSAAHYVESGGRVDEDTFLRIRNDLAGRDRYERFLSNAAREREFYAHRDAIHEGMAAGDQLREDLAAGANSMHDAEQRAQDIRQSQETVLDAAEAAVSEAEEAIFGAREDTPAADEPLPDADPSEASLITTLSTPSPR